MTRSIVRLSRDSAEQLESMLWLARHAHSRRALTADKLIAEIIERAYDQTFPHPESCNHDLAMEQACSLICIRDEECACMFCDGEFRGIPPKAVRAPRVIPSAELEAHQARLG